MRTSRYDIKMERSMLNVTYRERKTNTWVREKTKVTDVIESVRRRNRAGVVSRIRDNRLTLRITNRKRYERKRHRDSPTRLWRDELDDKALLVGYHSDEDSAR